jgi:hypothetical protein
MPQLEDLQMSMLCQIVKMIVYGQCLIFLLDLIDGFLYDRLASQHRHYSSRNIPRRDQVMEELYALGFKFNPEHELYKLTLKWMLKISDT